MKRTAPKVFFNASVILAGIRNPRGGSGKLLEWVRDKTILGIASEIILDESIRRSNKIGKTQNEVETLIKNIFSLLSAPSSKEVERWKNIVLDYGDCHVLASSKQSQCSYLVTLDRKHLLSISQKVVLFKIVSPKELIELIEKK